MSAIIYLLQVSACLALFYSFYYLLLSRLTFFIINRYYLLYTLLLSFVIPLLTIPVHQQYTAVPVVQQVINIRSSENIANYITPQITTEPVTWMQLLNWGYLIAVVALTIHLLITLTYFFAKLKRRKISAVGNIYILRGDKHLPNGSFLNYIFLNDDELSADEVQQIVAHEMLHVKLYHSADRILMKLVQIILWFNPFVYLYARSMEENHEFEVDREIARSNDKNKYADLLLHLSVANQGMLYHSFSKVPLKKRIVMLFNKPSAKIKTAVYILVLPVIVVSCLAFANIKKDDIVTSGKQMLTAIKNGQKNMIQQLNQPIQLPVALLKADSSKIFNDSITDQAPRPNTTNTSINYSALVGAGSTPFKKDALVKIDGKVYPTSILYELNGKGIAELSENAVTGEVDLTTQSGQLYYLTAHEKANIYKERAMPRSSLYIRLPLKRENGERYDFVSIGNKNNTMGGTRRIAPNDKVGFMVNGVLYDEDGFKKLSPEIISSITGIGPAPYKPDTLYYNKYKVLYMLSSTAYQQSEEVLSAKDQSDLIGFGPHNNQGIIKLINAYTASTKAAQANNQNIVAGSPTDTLSYKIQPFKVDARATLIEIVNKLPKLTTNDQDIFVGGKKVGALLVNGVPYNNNRSVLIGLRGLPANVFTEIQIMGTDPNNAMPATINVISRAR